MQKLIKIKPFEYAEKLKCKFSQDISLWYKYNTPKEAVDRLIKETNGDYSLIWQEHCGKCWASIDKTTPVAYASEDFSDWLCEKCYRKYLDGKCEWFEKY